MHENLNEESLKERLLRALHEAKHLWSMGRSPFVCLCIEHATNEWAVGRTYHERRVAHIIEHVIETCCVAPLDWMEEHDRAFNIARIKGMGLDKLNVYMGWDRKEVKALRAALFDALIEDFENATEEELCGY